jgi:hypothetical protein
MKTDIGPGESPATVQPSLVAGPAANAPDPLAWLDNDPDVVSSVGDSLLVKWFEISRDLPAAQQALAAEVWLRRWLYAGECPSKITQAIKLAETNRWVGFSPMFRQRFEDELKKPLRKSDDGRPPPDAGNLDEQETRIWGLLVKRVYAFLEADGLMALIPDGGHGDDDGIAIPFRFVAGEPGSVLDSKSRALNANEWIEVLEQLVELGPSAGGQAMRIEAVFPPERPPGGASVGLAVALAWAKRQARDLPLFSPLAVLATGKVSSRRVCAVDGTGGLTKTDTAGGAKGQLARRLGVQLYVAVDVTRSVNLGEGGKVCALTAGDVWKNVENRIGNLITSLNLTDAPRQLRRVEEEDSKLPSDAECAPAELWARWRRLGRLQRLGRTAGVDPQWARIGDWRRNLLERFGYKSFTPGYCDFSAVEDRHRDGQLRGRRQELQQLDDFVHGPGGFLLVTGPVGHGKSALLTTWRRNVDAQGKHSVFYHYFDQSDDRLQSYTFLYRRLLEHLLLEAQAEEQPPDKEPSVGDVLAAWERWRQAPDKKPLLVIIDGLDEALACPPPLPDNLTKDVWLVASCRSGADSLLHPAVAAWKQRAGSAYVGQLEVKALDIPNLCSWLATLSEDWTATSPEVQKLAAKVFDRTGGMALFIHYLLEDLRQAITQRRSVDEVLERTPVGFHQYLLAQWQRLNDAMLESPHARLAVKIVSWLSAARGTLTNRELLVLLDQPREMDLANLHPDRFAEARRWVDVRRGSLSDGWGARFSLDHWLLREAIGPQLRPDIYAPRLLNYCRNSWRESSPYALRHLPEHLIELRLWAELDSLVTDAKFQELQREAFPDEPALALAAVRRALETEASGRKPNPSALFSEGEIKDFPSFVAKLKSQSGPGAQFLWSQFSDKTRQQVGAYLEAHSEDEKLEVAVAEELNRIIQAGPIYGDQRFAGVTLSDETRSLQGSHLRGEQLVGFNRSLLEDAYPLEIARHLSPLALTELSLTHASLVHGMAEPIDLHAASKLPVLDLAERMTHLPVQWDPAAEVMWHLLAAWLLHRQNRRAERNLHLNALARSQVKVPTRWGYLASALLPECFRSPASPLLHKLAARLLPVEAVADLACRLARRKQPGWDAAAQIIESQLPANSWPERIARRELVVALAENGNWKAACDQAFWDFPKSPGSAKRADWMRLADRLYGLGTLGKDDSKAEQGLEQCYRGFLNLMRNAKPPWVATYLKACEVLGQLAAWRLGLRMRTGSAEQSEIDELERKANEQAERAKNQPAPIIIHLELAEALALGAKEKGGLFAENCRAKARQHWQKAQECWEGFKRRSGAHNLEILQNWLYIAQTTLRLADLRAWPEAEEARKREYWTGEIEAVLGIGIRGANQSSLARLLAKDPEETIVRRLEPVEWDEAIVTVVEALRDLGGVSLDLLASTICRARSDRDRARAISRCIQFWTNAEDLEELLRGGNWRDDDRAAAWAIWFRHRPEKEDAEVRGRFAARSILEGTARVQGWDAFQRIELLAEVALANPDRMVQQAGLHQIKRIIFGSQVSDKTKIRTWLDLAQTVTKARLTDDVKRSWRGFFWGLAEEAMGGLRGASPVELMAEFARAGLSCGGSQKSCSTALIEAAEEAGHSEDLTRRIAGLCEVAEAAAECHEFPLADKLFEEVRRLIPAREAPKPVNQQQNGEHLAETRPHIPEHVSTTPPAQGMKVKKVRPYLLAEWLSGLAKAASIHPRREAYQLRWAQQVQEAGFTVFSEGAIKAPLALATRLEQRGDPVSAFLWDRFPNGIRRTVATSAARRTEDDRLRAALLEGLNRAIKHDSIFEPTRFAGVTVSKETKSLLDQIPREPHPIRLNRLLLEDTYKKEISGDGLLNELKGEPDACHQAYRAFVATAAWQALFDQDYQGDKGLLWREIHGTKDDIGDPSIKARTLRDLAVLEASADRIDPALRRISEMALGFDKDDVLPRVGAIFVRGALDVMNLEVGERHLRAYLQVLPPSAEYFSAAYLMLAKLVRLFPRSAIAIQGVLIRRRLADTESERDNLAAS